VFLMYLAQTLITVAFGAWAAFFARRGSARRALRLRSGVLSICWP
jgi:hypothetical protein